jgi:O-succinylbenzoate synthase
MLPSVEELLNGAIGFSLPLTTRFRGTSTRQGILIKGPAGWGEFAPFPEYDDDESTRWLAAAIEAAWLGWPSPERHTIAVNAIVPAVSPEEAARMARESHCQTIKVKVAEAGQSLRDDLDRVAAVRDAVGSDAAIRIDANGAWSRTDAITAVTALDTYDLEYVEQPCDKLSECAAVRRSTDVRVALDEAIRKAPDPHHLPGLSEAADVLVLKVAPLGGVRPALAVAYTHELPTVVSSALDSSVGLAAGAALAASLPELSFACGLGSGTLLKNDVCEDRLLPVDGALEVRQVTVDPDSVSAVELAPNELNLWRRRFTSVYERLMSEAGAS